LPGCYQREIIRYGRNPQGSNVQCRHCKKVWTPKQPAHRHPIARTICSVLIVPFQGANAASKLYVLFSFDAFAVMLCILPQFHPIL
jgi:hypothetical protein